MTITHTIEPFEFEGRTCRLTLYARYHVRSGTVEYDEIVCDECVDLFSSTNPTDRDDLADFLFGYDYPDYVMDELDAACFEAYHDPH